MSSGPTDGEGNGGLPRIRSDHEWGGELAPQMNADRRWGSRGERRDNHGIHGRSPTDRTRGWGGERWRSARLSARWGGWESVAGLAGLGGERRRSARLSARCGGWESVAGLVGFGGERRWSARPKCSMRRLRVYGGFDWGIGPADECGPQMGMAGRAEAQPRNTRNTRRDRKGTTDVDRTHGWGGERSRPHG